MICGMNCLIQESKDDVFDKGSLQRAVRSEERDPNRFIVSISNHPELVTLRADRTFGTPKGVVARLQHDCYDEKAPCALVDVSFHVWRLPSGLTSFLAPTTVEDGHPVPLANVISWKSARKASARYRESTTNRLDC